MGANQTVSHHPSAAAVEAARAYYAKLCELNGDDPQPWQQLSHPERSELLELAGAAIAGWLEALPWDHAPEAVQAEIRPDLGSKLVSFLRSLPGRGACTISQAAAYAATTEHLVVCAVYDSARLMWLGDGPECGVLTLVGANADNARQKVKQDAQRRHQVPGQQQLLLGGAA